MDLEKPIFTHLRVNIDFSPPSKVFSLVERPPNAMQIVAGPECRINRELFGSTYDLMYRMPNLALNTAQFRGTAACSKRFTAAFDPTQEARV